MTSYRHSRLNQRDLSIFRRNNTITHVVPLLCITLMSYSLYATVPTEDTIVRVEMKEKLLSFKKDRASNDPLNQVRAFFQLDRAQHDVSQGIVFVVDIVNESDDSVELADPTEYVYVHLLNEQGWACSRRPVPTMSLIKTGDPKTTRARLDARRAFVIERDGVDPRLFKTAHDIKEGKIQLEPGEQLRLVLRIEKIVANAREYQLKRRQYTKEVNPHSPDFKEAHLRMASPRPIIVPIAAGTYKLDVGVLLIRLPSDSGAAKSLKSDKVTLRLGPQSNDSK